jgi:hypothetical protein
MGRRGYIETKRWPSPPSRHCKCGLQFLEFCILGLLCRLLPRIDTARTRWSVHWHMICAHKSFVEVILLELRQLCLELLLK